MSHHLRSPESLRAHVMEQREKLKQAAAAPAGTPQDPNLTSKGSPPPQPEANSAASLNVPAGSLENRNPTDVTPGMPGMALTSDTKPEGPGGTSPSTSAPVIDEATQKAAAALAKLRDLAKGEQPAAAATPDKSASAGEAAAAAAAGAPAGDPSHDDLTKMAAAVLLNIGHVMCSTAEGQAAAMEHLTKYAGAEKARTMLEDAHIAMEIAKQASIEDMQIKEAFAQQARIYQEAFAKLDPAQQKVAAVMEQLAHQEAQKFQYPDDQHFFLKGAAAMPASGEMPADGQIPGAEGPSPDELLQMLMGMVESGEITIEEAVQVAQQAGLELPPEMLAAAGGAGGEAGAPPAAAAEEIGKQASVLFAGLDLA